MYWPWTGYINIRAEGISPTSPTKAFTYHLGGYSGADNTVRTLNFSFPDQNLRCTPAGKPQVQLVRVPMPANGACPDCTGE
jgi:hypothetical protein